MRGVVMHAPGDVRVEDREDPKIIEPTDAIIRLTATCICGSRPVALPRRRAGRPPGDGPRVRRRRRGDRLRGRAPSRSATSSSARSGPPTTPARSARPATRPTACTASLMGTIGTQSELARIPLADGTLVATPGQPDPDLIPSLLAASDVLGTGWFAAVAAEAGPARPSRSSVTAPSACSAILAAKQLGAERIIAIQPPRRPAGAGPRVRRHRHRRGARRRRRRQGQGAHRRARRALGHRGRRHPGGDDAGHPLHPPRRPRRVRRRLPRRRDPRRRAVLGRRPHPRRPRPGAAVPARPDPAHLGPQDRPRQGLRPHPPARARPPRATRPWTSAAPPRSCSPSDAPSLPRGRTPTDDPIDAGPATATWTALLGRRRLVRKELSMPTRLADTPQGRYRSTSSDPAAPSKPGEAPHGRALGVVLCLLTVFGPISMDLYLPVLPALATDLGASTSAAQLTVTACLLGLAFGQVVAGPLSDRFGRRRPLLVGVAAYIAASVLCAVAPTIETLIAARLVQGLAGAVGIVIAQAAGRDLFTGGRLLRYYGRLTVLAGLAAIIGPVIGGQLAKVTDWRGTFVFLAAVGVLILAASAGVLRETLPPARRHTGGLADSVRVFRRLLRDQVFLGQPRPTSGTWPAASSSSSRTSRPSPTCCGSTCAPPATASKSSVTVRAPSTRRATFGRAPSCSTSGCRWRRLGLLVLRRLLSWRSDAGLGSRDRAQGSKVWAISSSGGSSSSERRPRSSRNFRVVA